MTIPTCAGFSSIRRTFTLQNICAPCVGFRSRITAFNWQDLGQLGWPISVVPVSADTPDLTTTSPCCIAMVFSRPLQIPM